MPSAPLTPYDLALDPVGSQLVANLISPTSGIEVVAGSVVLAASAASAVSLYDGSLSLGIGAGLLLTSGTSPGFSNTVGWFGTDNTQYLPDGTAVNYDNGSAAIDAVVNAVFQTQSFDATTLSFEFTVADPTATSVSFDIVFGSEEYPEWVDQFVDCAVVIVNGVNYAYFAHDPSAPLSVIGQNLAAGYFQDNSGNIIPIEYDGISKSMTIVAPIIRGAVNTIQIGIADTGDHVYDSGIFIANMTAGSIPGSGVVLPPDVPCTAGDDIVTGTVADELIRLLDGNDTAFAGGGDDIIIAGSGDDKVYGGSGDDALEGDDGNDLLDGGEGTGNQAVYSGNSADYQVSFNAGNGKYVVAGAEGTDTLTNIQLVKCADGLFDLTQNGLVPHSVTTPTTENIAGTVVVSGAALVGQTLTAFVFDNNGLPADIGAISYHWMTSADGVNWLDTQVAINTYTLGEQDLGLQVMVSVSYTDTASFAETCVSIPVEIKGKNDLAISLIQITAPDGFGVENPLTTLLTNAIAVGVSANLATFSIKAALNLPDIDFKTYDPVAILSVTPADATALAVLKICGELAMLISASDPTGYNLTLAVLDAATQGLVLNLADPDQVSALMSGSGAPEIDIVQTTTNDMNDASGIDGIMAAWNDFCGNTDGMEQYQDTFGHFNAHLNQGPTGFGTAILDFGTIDLPYMITQHDLLLGFSDPDGDVLAVADLVANLGGSLSDNGDGTWTFTPDAGFTGAVELSYTVSDPSGKTVAGTNMLVIANAAQDATPPAVTSFTFPTSDDAVQAGDTVMITVNMTEAVLVVDTPTLALANGGTATYLSGSGTLQLTFAYTVVAGQDVGDLGTAISTALVGTITDLAGNALADDAFDALNPVGTFVVDTVAPTVTIFNPTDGATLVDIDAKIVLTFSEMVSGGSGLITLHSGSADGPVVESFDVSSGSNVSFSGATLTLTPTAPLANATVFFLVIGSTCLIDAAGNAYSGTNAYDFRTAAAGNLILGTSEADTLLGTSGVDIILGQGGDDILTGAAGIDVLDAGEGSDIYVVSTTADHGAAEFSDTGGSGADQVRFAAIAASTLTFYAADTGIESVVIGTGTAASAVTTATTAINIDATTAANGLSMLGNAGANILSGSVYGDSLNGGAGNDSLVGGGGNDTLMGASGNDVLVGNDGVDTATYASATASVTVSLALSTAQASIGDGTDTLTTIENLIGSGFADILTGSATANQIDGGAGADTINGAEGADTLLGGSGNDLFVVSLAADMALGEEITGGDGTDEVRFISTVASTLTLTTGVSVERVVVGTGVAAMAVSKGTTAINVTAAALQGAVTIIGNAGVNALTGGNGDDSLNGGAGNDVLIGGMGDDTLTGGVGNDSFFAALGTDTITDLGGGDNLSVASGAVVNAAVTAAWTATVGTTNAGTVNVTSAGFAVNLAAVTGGLVGYSVTNTAATAATLTGSKFNDTLTGGAGADILMGGFGNDSLTGNAGNDTFTVVSGTDTITDLGASDVLTVASGATTNAIVTAAWTATKGTTNAGTALLSTNGSAVNLTAVTGGTVGYHVTNTGVATLLTGSKFADTITGGVGADTITGGGGIDSLLGGDGNDLFFVALAADLASAEVINGGDGTDELRFTSTAAGTLTLTSGVAVENVVIGTGVAAVAVTTATKAINVNAASAANGLSILGNAGVNTLTGSGFNDSLDGGAGNDSLIGGAGSDRLTGGLGNDTLTGGSDADVFIFNSAPNASSNKDTITDFNATDDDIWLAKAAMAGLTAGTLSAVDFRGGAGFTTSGDATDRVVYNQTTGVLYYDADGTGATAAVQFAQVTAGTILSAADFFIF